MRIEVFLDTNILVYAYDLDAGKKRTLARELLIQAYQNPQQYAVSIQVLQEFHVNFIRSGGTQNEAMELLKDFSNWKIVENTLPVYRLGLEIQTRYQLSLWDAMIVASAQTCRASLLYTEDLNHGQSYAGVRVVNPFM